MGRMNHPNEEQMPNCVTQLTCIHCQSVISENRGCTQPWLTCPACGPADGILDIAYDMDAVRASWKAQPLASRPLNHWRYRELLPLDTLSIPDDWTVGWTPLVEATRLADQWELEKLWLKDEGRNPTASFKDRASSVGVAHALQNGAQTIACASTGNAATSLAGHAALAGLPAVIFVPATAPEPKLAQLLVYGATVIAVEGTYDQAYNLCSAACQRYGWYNRNCAMNPVLVEGKKTGGLEIAEQTAALGEVPDWVAVSVGDGCTIAGIWKGLVQMHQLGILDKLPKLLSVQALDVAPIHHAVRYGDLPEVCDGNTMADSIDVPVPRNWRKAVRAIEESDGIGIEVTDEEILEAMRTAGRHGVFAEPAAAAAVAGIQAAVSQGVMAPRSRVLAMITGSGLKDTRSAIRAGGRLIRTEPDMDKLDEHT